MSIEFREARLAPLEPLSIIAPGAAIIGIAGEKGSGEAALLRLAAGQEQPESGEIVFEGSRRYFGVTGALNLAPADLIVIAHSFAQADPLVRARAEVALDRLRTVGSTILIASHESALLRRICDEVWWFESGKLEARGDPREVLDKYAARIATKFRAWGETLSFPIAPSFRRGDRRAEIVSLETIGEQGRPSGVLASGEGVTVRVVVKFREAVENPVVGIMIRTRIGLEVYGTNTELENIRFGPCRAGQTVRIEFIFRCDLCPKEYTVTAASHDPDGTAHDWMDDAIAFVVTDSRSTAGVANLRSRVSVETVDQAD